MPDPELPLPRPPEDPDRLRRLREEALRRVEDEERRYPITVYGGPPIGGGGNGGSPVTRRWTLRGLLLALLGFLAGLGAAYFGWRRYSAPVYGGPPVLRPDGRNPPAAVYGGPVPPPAPEQTPRPSPNPPPSTPAPKKHPKSPPAPVYGGAPQQPPG